MYMIGFQCSAPVQPVFGRNGLYSSTSHQTSSTSSNSSSNSNSPSNSTASSSLSTTSNSSSSSSSSLSTGPYSRSPSTLSPNLLDYFPGCNGDGLKIKWAHAINSRLQLNAAILGDESIIEGDVTLAESNRYPIPIMAHPPLSLSDITLEDWLIEIVRNDSTKGIKLDFKSTRVVEPAFRVLTRHSDYIKGPLILNADILSGSNKPSISPVDAWTFLILCRTRFPKAIISIGWTTQIDDLSLKIGYSREMIDQMASLVKEYSLLQPITFPVNASLLRTSIPELQRLLYQVPNSSLTLWAHPGDPLSHEDLFIFRKSFATHQLFYDLPEDMLAPLRAQSYRR